MDTQLENLPTSSELPLQADLIEPRIDQDGTQVTARFEQLHLTADAPTSKSIDVTFTKQPLDIVLGSTYADGKLTYTRESDIMLQLASEAEKIRELPEEARPRAILELLRRHVHYAYDDAVDTLAMSDPDKAQWVRDHTGLHAPHHAVELADVFEHGYGICRHLHLAYLYLAQKAGLGGMLLTCVAGTIQNVTRHDSEEPLFRSAPVGEAVGAHSWCEVQLSDGTWIPVDPSTQLVGDSPEHLRVFLEAHYEGRLVDGFTPDWGPMDELRLEQNLLPFQPGSAQTTGTFYLRLNSSIQAVRFGKGPQPQEAPSNEPFTGNAYIKITAGSERGNMNLKVAV